LYLVSKDNDNLLSPYF